ncbi:uncharacterized protein TRUGW13939_00787 [Talaromyces rugulosus]|uniref:Uncharacterized protein n=1 Tax=Talaromyces rugulosus TaxID=121627 RepID=A0A7H8QI77_TALRU|nr:uncharacterized protein TRUGW13939_00787 [Talaromyces rugulosus]QKX53707.1 hypothetical protein TRUGW13939_00787 [Talaromyces rugulosus]
MSQFLPLRISPSNPALALVVSLLLSSGVRADNNHGTDAPDTPGTSSGDSGSSADNAAGASGSNGGLSKTAQIVIGVVVGAVCLAAIGLGVWFFLRKKRKWDEQAKRYETIHAFRKSAGARRENEMSLRPPKRRRRRDREQQRDLERGNVETSEPGLPRYDPSAFQHKNEHSIDSTRGLSIDLARHSFVMDNNRYQQHQRNSSQFSGIMRPPPPPGPPPGRGSTSMEMTSSLDMSRGASPTEGADHSNTDSPTPMLQGSRGGFRGTFKGPKKPKPVLTRLITNL